MQRGAAVTLIQRFGSAANLNIHLHGLVLDGVYHLGAEGAPVFHPAPALTSEQLQALLGKIITRILRLLTREGHLVEEEGVTYVADAHGILDPESPGRFTADPGAAQGPRYLRDQIEDVRCYLTGESRADGTFSVTHYTVRDKHGLTRSVYNAKINIHRREAEPIFLGIRHKDLNLS